MTEANAAHQSSAVPVAIVNLMTQGFGGQETHVLHLYKQLLLRGRDPILLVAANSPMHLRTIEAGFTCYTIPYWNVPGYYRVLSLLLPVLLAWLCKRHKIGIVHCNHRFEVRSALYVAKMLDIKVILNHHVTTHLETKTLRSLHAFIAPDVNNVRYVVEENRANGLGIKEIKMIPPLFDADKFLSFGTELTRGTWFQKTFGITLEPWPIICAIGNMVPDLKHKNYPLLFKALATLIHEKKSPIQAVLVGDGPVRPYLEGLAQDLAIQKHIHFLGFTSQHTPGVLFHSDIFVLASSREAFGIVFLEAALMRKPSIGARGTGAETIIIDKETGLLFENGSADSLAAVIQALVSDSLWAKELGDRAYNHVSKHFVPSRVVEQYEGLYTSLSSSL